MNERWHTYAQLVRLPAVFTALADICLAVLAVAALPGHGLRFVLLLGTSACLYCAGMVWNDYFDLEQDRRERSFRPIPSGRVMRSEALRLGAALLAAGLILAILAGLVEGGFRVAPFVIAVLLAGAILAYDGWLKRTWAGPLGMGLCRYLNVLLGLSVLGAIYQGPPYLAFVIGVYIIGVTWFARTEARVSRRGHLRGAAAVMLASLVLALAVPVLAVTNPEPERIIPPVGTFLFPYLLVGLGFLVGLPIVRAIQSPTPLNVQAAVRRCLMGLVLYDAILATSLAGVVGLAILLLLLPALYLSRWLYAT